MNLKSSELFMNMKHLPPEGSREYDQLIEWEIEKCLGGVNVNGVHISNWLYFHINHWFIRVDAKDNYGNVTRIRSLPDLRDNEWERAEALERCRLERKGYMEIGLRQGGKSELEASVTGHSALMFENTQNVIVGGNSPDLQLLTDKLDFGLKHMWSGIGIGKIDKDWRKPQVRLGVKGSDNENDVWSYIMIRNAQEGNNTEAPAGTTAKSFIMDEVGKYPFSSVLESAKPAFLSEFGWRCIPILVGTGGSFENGADAERIFYHPEANNFLAYDQPDGSKTCLFMPGTYRQDCKVEMNLADYLINIKGLELKSTKELEKIKIKVSDKEKALEVITADRVKKAKDPDQVEYLKQIMYYPLTPQECFLSATQNMFNVDAAKKQKDKLEQLNMTGVPVEIFHDGDKLTHRHTNQRPISTFPLKDKENIAGCVVLYEPPVPNAPFGLYVAGIDPYKQDVSLYSSSLGSIYIYKRMHNISDEKYQDMIVAQYVGRPPSIAQWNEIVRNLIKYYNAYALSESEDYGFIQYMINKGDAMYLMPQPMWLTDISPNASSKRTYGIPATPRIINHLNGVLKLYTEEIITKVVDDNGSMVREILGFSKILDPLLLAEMIDFNPSGNYDRIRAASIAIEVARRLDEEKIKVSTTENDPRLKSYFAGKPVRSVLGSGDSKSKITKRHKPFRY